MDANDLRGLLTVLGLVAFLGIVFWAYSSKRKADFDEAALLPFTDDETTPENSAAPKSRGQ